MLLPCSAPYKHLSPKETAPPPPATIQNAYSLMTRGFEEGLAEACSPRHNNIGLLPWSILCGGLLSGKYSGHGHAEPSSRFVQFEDYMSRWHPKHARQETLEAAAAYTAIAEKAGLTPSQLAILWCRTRPFVQHGAVIVGATSMEQLAENLDAFDLEAESLMSDEMKAGIDAVHLKCRDPSNSL